ncbi:dihydroorotate dehydrogenase electron transfer subunit [Peptococcaceae bacterium 1198_IL3148]
MSLIVTGTIVKQLQVATNYYLLEITAPQLAQLAQPGQFVHVQCSGNSVPLLRRPISINSVNRRSGTVTILYRVVGEGTRLLADKRVGDLLNVIGPLGKGFSVVSSSSKVILVAGGIGIAPLYFLLQELLAKGVKPTVLIGARTADDLLLISAIKALGVTIEIATEDGSAGVQGRVTELLPKYLPDTDMIYTCGPTPMMQAVALIAQQKDIATEVSLEERMGCGVGACLACSCKIKVGTGNEYKRVCADGPVFNAGEVCWGE